MNAENTTGFLAKLAEVFEVDASMVGVPLREAKSSSAEVSSTLVSMVRIGCWITSRTPTAAAR